MTTVVHFNEVKAHWSWRLRRWDSDAFTYIGRPNKEYHLPPSPWANPIRLHSGSAESRAKAIEQYYAWITTSDVGRSLMLRLHELRGRVLVCWCKPLACHGDVLLELLGEREHVHQPVQAGLDGVQASRPPLLLWDDGMAGQRIDKNRSGMLFRSSEPIKRPLGVPGKAYVEWSDWYRDFLKDTLRVRGCALTMTHAEFARYRYETRLARLEGRDEARSIMERQILHELLDELKG